MNCAIHPEAIASAFCRNCGNAICDACKTDWQGAAHCPECAAKMSAAVKERKAYAPPPPPPPRYARAEAPSPAGAPTPVLAAMLGLIPGVGAVYNGQYAKSVFHVVVFGGLISLMSSGASDGFEPLFGFLIALFYFYMPLEAYRTAKALQSGEPVDEFSGWISSSPRGPRSPLAGIALIVLGLVFLMHTMGFWSLRELARYWPVILILLGANMLYRRFSEAQGNGGSPSRGRRRDSSLSIRDSASYPPSAAAETVAAETPSEAPASGYEEQPESRRG
jgi:hypothetical protein